MDKFEALARVKVKEAAILDHRVPHYRGIIGTVWVDRKDYVTVLWNGWTSTWKRDELEVA